MDHFSLAPNCTDGLKNQDETDVDCGGLNCGACEDTQNCLTDTDCSSKLCTDNICTATSTTPFSNPISNGITNSISAILFLCVVFTAII